MQPFSCPLGTFSTHSGLMVTLV